MTGQLVQPRGSRSVCMLVSNDMVSDPRVARHAEALGSHGFKVTVICPISNRTEPYEIKQGYEIIRPRSIILEKLSTELAEKWRAIYENNGHSTLKDRALTKILALATLLLTQLTLFGAAVSQRARIYCANDLDTLPVTLLAAGLSRKVVYDSHELWPDMMLVPESVKAIVRAIEGLLIKQTDIVMTVNEFLAEVLASRYSLKTPPQVVYNCPNASLPIRHREKRTAPKIALYQGQFTRDRGLDKLLKATDYLLPDVRLVLRGFGIIERELKALSVGRTNVQFEKPVNASKLVSAASEADIGIIPYLPTNLNNYLASPNKLFEYIQAGLPIAASNTPFMRKVILENDIGMLFDSQDPRSIANTLNSVTREDLLRRQRANLVSAAKKYNWETESKKLLHAYEGLLSPS